MFYVWLDGHDMRIIEADGVRVSLIARIGHRLTKSLRQTDTEEYPIEMLSLSVAQRYSVLVTARNDTDLNYA